MRDEIAAGRLGFMVIGSAKALDKACEQVGLAHDSLPLSMIDVGPVEGVIKPERFRPSAANGHIARSEAAPKWCRPVKADTIVTAHLSKEALHLAGHHFEGHTELLAHPDRHATVVMLAHGPMRVSHVTTHCPIGEVLLVSRRLACAASSTSRSTRSSASASKSRAWRSPRSTRTPAKAASSARRKDDLIIAPIIKGTSPGA